MEFPNSSFPEAAEGQCVSGNQMLWAHAVSMTLLSRWSMVNHIMSNRNQIVLQKEDVWMRTICKRAQCVYIFNFSGSLYLLTFGMWADLCYLKEGEHGFNLHVKQELCVHSKHIWEKNQSTKANGYSLFTWQLIKAAVSTLTLRGCQIKQ